MNIIIEKMCSDRDYNEENYNCQKIWTFWFDIYQVGIYSEIVFNLRHFSKRHSGHSLSNESTTKEYFRHSFKDSTITEEDIRNEKEYKWALKEAKKKLFNMIEEKVNLTM